mgnify:CR=1 FL=1
MRAHDGGDARAGARVARRLLEDDAHYRASAPGYGDGGLPALERALDLFLAHPEIGFVWIAHATADDAASVVASRVTPFPRLAARLSSSSMTSRFATAGAVAASAARCSMRWQRICAPTALADIDTACHRENTGAWRFYERLGYRPLDEEQIALLL